MKLTLEAIEAIDAIERHGSYAAAAEALNKVPSALSYVVQNILSRMAHRPCRRGATVVGTQPVESAASP